jgi:hypothetical protein
MAKIFKSAGNSANMSEGLADALKLSRLSLLMKCLGRHKVQVWSNCAIAN